MRSAGASSRSCSPIPAVKNTDRRQGRAELDEHAQGVNAAEIDVTLKTDVEKEQRVRAVAARVLGDPRNERHHRPADRPPHRSHAVRHAREHCGQDLRTRPVRAAPGRRAGARRDADRSWRRRPSARAADRRAAASDPGRPWRARAVRHDRRTARPRRSTSRSTARRSRRCWRKGGAATSSCDFPGAARANAEAICSVTFDTPTGQRVPLSQLARDRVDRGPNTVSARERAAKDRRAGERGRAGSREHGRRHPSRRSAERVIASLGYHVEYGGQFESAGRIDADARGALALSIAAIFLILFAEFRSARTATLVMANLPLP